MILDNNDVLNEELISKWVSEVIHREVSKPDGEADLELIDECEKTLSCLNDGGGLSEEELKKRLGKIMSKSSYQAASVHKLRAKSKRRIALAAACMVVIMLIGMVTAYATVSSFNDMIRGVLGMPVGSSVDDGEITFINDGKTKQYSSLDELIEAENLRDYNIMIPKNLPDELKIRKVVFTAHNDEKKMDIQFFDKSIKMGIEIGGAMAVASASEKVEINGLVVYIDEYEDQYFASLLYKDNVYYVTSTDRNIIITIFEHMNKE